MPAAPECGLANGLPSVTVVTLSTCGQAWLCPEDNRLCSDRPCTRLIGRLMARVPLFAFSPILMAIGLVFAGGDVRAAESEARKAPEAVRAPELAGGQDDLVARSTMLEREQRWADVVSLCETAARKGALAPELQQRYDLAKIHCDLARRHCEHAFRKQLGKLKADPRGVMASMRSPFPDMESDRMRASLYGQSGG